MLTVDYATLGIAPGQRLLDIGCGAGRHSYEAMRRGAHTVAADLDDVVLKDVRQLAAAMEAEGQVPGAAALDVMATDALQLPFQDETFDRVIASEVLEHIPDDEAALREIHRVTKVGGMVAVTVPRRWPERVCWMLSREYHDKPGGHVRIYSKDTLVARLSRAGFRVGSHHYAHALHSPYWWLKCAVGVDRETPMTRAYHRFLVWDLMHAPHLLRSFERLLNPLLGKSLVIYAYKVL